MNATEFDRLVKRVSGVADRRRLLAGLLGLVVSGGLGAREATADETPKPNGKRCSKDAQCQSGHCCKSGSAKRGICQACCADDVCGFANFCSGGTCVACSETSQPCCPYEVVPGTNNTCGPGLTCTEGRCVPS